MRLEHETVILWTEGRGMSSSPTWLPGLDGTQNLQDEFHDLKICG